MIKVSILGHFALGTEICDGQTVKTRNLAELLVKDKELEITKIDTYGWTKNPISLFAKIKNAFKTGDAVIMLPAQNGVKIFSPVLAQFKKKYGKKIFYDVIGGWLPKFLTDKKRLSKTLMRFDGIWAETSTMKKSLEALGFENISVIPNFKGIKVLEKSELVYTEGIPLRLCIFSRVMKEKGIEDAVNAVRLVNERLKYKALELDIYGPVDSAQTEWFEEVKKGFPEYVEYKGVIAPEKSVETVKNYFALLFPTRFFTEGIPGTIIDAYAAGVPVISARWESFDDMVEDGKTGLGYEFGNAAELVKILLSVTENPEALNSLKKNCTKKAEEFLPESALSLITGQIKN